MAVESVEGRVDPRAGSVAGGAPYLMAAHGAIVGSGFLFWLIAGRLLGAAALGAVAAAISVAMLATTLAQIGLPQAMLRYSRESRDPAALGGAALTALWLLAAVAGLAGGFVLDAATAGFEVTPATRLGIVVGCIGAAQAALVWHIASAAQRPWVALGASAVEAALKVLLVAPLALRFGSDGALLAWALSVSAASAVGAWGLLPRAAGHQLYPRWPRRRLLQPVARFSLASYVGDLFVFTPTSGLLGWLIPLIVVARYGAEAGGVFYIVWSIAGALNAVPFALSTMAVARGAAARAISPGRGRFIARLVLPAVPVALVVAALASPLLAVLGDDYAAQGTPVLRVLAAGFVVVSANAGLSAVLKLRHETRALHTMGVLVIGPAVVAAAVFNIEWGLQPIAVAWVAAQLGALAVTLAVTRLTNAPRRAMSGTAVRERGRRGIA